MLLSFLGCSYFSDSFRVWKIWFFSSKLFALPPRHTQINHVIIKYGGCSGGCSGYSSSDMILRILCILFCTHKVLWCIMRSPNEKIWIMSSDQWEFEIFNREIYRKKSNFVVITVPIDGLAPNGARPSAGTVKTKYGSWVYMGTALIGSITTRRNNTKRLYSKHWYSM